MAAPNDRLSLYPAADCVGSADRQLLPRWFDGDRTVWSPRNDVFAAIRLSCKNCVGAAFYGLLSLSQNLRF